MRLACPWMWCALVIAACGGAANDTEAADGSSSSSPTTTTSSTSSTSSSTDPSSSSTSSTDASSSDDSTGTDTTGGTDSSGDGSSSSTTRTEGTEGTESGSDSTGGSHAACTAGCMTEFACSDAWASVEDCEMWCEDNLVEAAMFSAFCATAWETLSACFGTLSCEEYGEYLEPSMFPYPCAIEADSLSFECKGQ